ncbi:hypothetical protein [Wenzhou picorna-like virus 44]|uniref:hypothetical protein n=1 Tax=Wenzhou picorna-like virus 44 TaxID=1923631 RepID=UPI00090A11C6|nr:hypothetical protein [Wenzhou picorna-like virus 44]APG78587.1 hypothetical protein [Wenzhou picorna-like virus 44]
MRLAEILMNMERRSNPNRLRRRGGVVTTIFGNEHTTGNAFITAYQTARIVTPTGWLTHVHYDAKVDHYIWIKPSDLYQLMAFMRVKRTPKCATNQYDCIANMYHINVAEFIKWLWGLRTMHPLLHRINTSTCRIYLVPGEPHTIINLATPEVCHTSQLIVHNFHRLNAWNAEERHVNHGEALEDNVLVPGYACNDRLFCARGDRDSWFLGGFTIDNPPLLVLRGVTMSMPPGEFDFGIDADEDDIIAPPQLVTHPVPAGFAMPNPPQEIPGIQINLADDSSDEEEQGAAANPLAVDPLGEDWLEVHEEFDEDILALNANNNAIDDTIHSSLPDVEWILPEVEKVVFHGFGDQIKELKGAVSTFTSISEKITAITTWINEIFEKAKSKLSAFFGSAFTGPVLAVITAFGIYALLARAREILGDLICWACPEYTKKFLEKYKAWKESYETKDDEHWTKKIYKLPIYAVGFLSWLVTAFEAGVGIFYGIKVFKFCARLFVEASDETAISLTAKPGCDADGNIVDIAAFENFAQTATDEQLLEAGFSLNAKLQSDMAQGTKLCMAIVVALSGLWVASTEAQDRKKEDGAYNIPKALFSFVKTATATSTALTAISAIIRHVYSWIPAMWRVWLYETFKIPPGHAWEYPAVKDWVSGITGLDALISADRALLTSCANTRREVQELYTGTPFILRTLEELKASPLEVREVQRLQKIITQYMKMVWALRGEHPVRQRPTCVMICGKSSLGKSTMVSQFAQDVMEMPLRSDSDQCPLIYGRQQNSDFWDGYQNQKVVVYDDFGANTQSNEAAELITLISCNEFMPAMASLDDANIGIKGTRFNSELVVLSTNVSPNTTFATVSCAEALRNRYHIPVQAVVVSKYIKNGVIDFETVAQDAKKQGDPAPHLRFVPINPHTGHQLMHRVDGHDEPIALTYAQLVNWTKAEVNKSRAAFKATLEKQKSPPEEFNEWATARQQELLQSRVTLWKLLTDAYISVSTRASAAGAAVLGCSSKLVRQVLASITKWLGQDPRRLVHSSVYTHLEAGLLSADRAVIMGNEDGEAEALDKRYDITMLAIAKDLEKSCIAPKLLDLLARDSEAYQAFRTEVDAKRKRYELTWSAEVQHYFSSRLRYRMTDQAVYMISARDNYRVLAEALGCQIVTNEAMGKNPIGEHYQVFGDWSWSAKTWQPDLKGSEICYPLKKEDLVFEIDKLEKVGDISPGGIINVDAKFTSNALSELRLASRLKDRTFLLEKANVVSERILDPLDFDRTLRATECVVTSRDSVRRSRMMRDWTDGEYQHQFDLFYQCPPTPEHVSSEDDEKFFDASDTDPRAWYERGGSWFKNKLRSLGDKSRMAFWQVGQSDGDPYVPPQRRVRSSDTPSTSTDHVHEGTPRRQRRNSGRQNPIPEISGSLKRGDEFISYEAGPDASDVFDTRVRADISAYSNERVPLVDAPMAVPTLAKLESDVERRTWRTVGRAIADKFKRVGVIIQQHLKMWLNHIPTWGKYVIAALTAFSACGALVWTIYQWWTKDSEAIKLDSMAGQQRDKMLKLVSLCSKDVNQTLNTLPLSELRDVLKLKLEECNVVDPDPTLISELMGGVCNTKEGADAFRDQIADMLSDLPADIKANLPTLANGLDETQDWSIVKLANAKQQLVDHFRTLIGPHAQEALEIANLTPRLYSLFKNLSPNEVEAVAPGEPAILESAGGSKPCVRSKANMRWKTQNKSALKRITKGRHYKFIKGRLHGEIAEGAAVEIEAENHAGELQKVIVNPPTLPKIAFGKIETVKGVNKLYFIPVKGHVILLPKHFFMNVADGDELRVIYNGVVFIDNFDSTRLKSVKFAHSTFTSEVSTYMLSGHLPLFPDQTRFFPEKEIYPNTGCTEQSYILHRDGLWYKAQAMVSPWGYEAKSKLNNSSITREITTFTGLRVPGDCGLPVIARCGNAGFKILGIHVYQSLVDNREGAAAVTALIVKSLLNSYPQDVLLHGSVETHAIVETACDRAVPLEGNFEIIGVLPTKRGIPSNTTLRPSPCKGRFGISRDVHAPAPLKNDDPRVDWKLIGKSPKPLSLLAVEKYAPVLRPYPPELRAVAREWELHERNQIPIEYPVRELTMEEAINGYGNMSRIDLNTAPGYGWGKISGGKKRGLFTEDEDGQLQPIPELRAAIVKIIDAASEGVYAECVWCDSLKDELRHVGKVEQGKVRAFTLADVALLIAVRMVMGAIFSVDSIAWKHTSSAVGMNPWSPDWDKMMQYLGANSTNGLDADWKAFDSTVGAEEWYDEYLVDRQWWKLHAKETLPGFENRLYIMYYAMCHRLTVNGDVLYRLHSGNGSGGPKTTVINTRANDRRMKMAWLANPDTPKDYTTFKQNVRSKFYGDDTAATVSDKYAGKFNGKSISSFHKEFSRTMTPANKLGVFTDRLMNLEDLTFLSVETKRMCREGIEYWPSPADTITDKSVNWVRTTNDMSVEQNLAMRLNATILRFAYMEEVEYLRLIQKLTSVVNEVIPSADPLLTFPTWRELQEAFLKNEIEWSYGDIFPIGAVKGTAVTLHMDNETPSVVIPSNVGAIEGVVSGLVENTGGVKFAEPGAPRACVGAEPKVQDKSINQKTFTVKGLAERYAYLDTLEWSTSDARYSIVGKWRLPHDILKANPIRTPIEKFRFFRSHVNVKFILNGTRFHSGQLIAYWCPLMEEDDISDWQQVMFSSQTVLRHVYMQPRSDSPVEILCPFVHPKQYFNTTNLNNDAEFMGTLVLAVINPLEIDATNATGLGGNHVPVSVYVELVDLECAVPTGTPVSIHGVGSSKISRVVITGNNNTVPLEFGSDAVEQSADISSMDNPTLAFPPVHVSRRGHPPYSYAEGTEYMDKLVLYPEQISPAEVTHFGTDVDEMDITKLCQIPTYCETFMWEAAAVPETRIASGFISPTDCLNHPKFHLDRNIPMCEFIAKQFNLWSGSIGFVFDVIASAVHTGKLLFTVHYGLDAPPKDMDSAACEFSVVLALSEDQSRFEVEIPYVADVPQKFIVNGHDSLLEGSVGVWCLWVLNNLRTPGIAVPHVEVNLYKFTGPDFHLSYLGANGAEIVPTSAFFHAGGNDMTNIEMGAGAGQHTPMYTEKYDSLRDIARRFVPFDKKRVPKSDGTIAYYKVRDLIYCIARPWNGMYLGWRGGIRLRVTYSEPCTLVATFIPTVDGLDADGANKVGNYLTGKQTSSKYMCPAIVGTNADVGFVDFEIPYVTPYKFLIKSRETKYEDYANTGDVVIAAVFADPAAAKKESFQFYVSGADDFRMGIIAGIPKVKSTPNTIVDPDSNDFVLLPGEIILDYGPNGHTAARKSRWPRTDKDKFVKCRVHARSSVPVDPAGQFVPYVQRVGFDTRNLSDAALTAMGFVVVGKARLYRPDYTIVIDGSHRPFSLPYGSGAADAWYRPQVYPSTMYLRMWMHSDPNKVKDYTAKEILAIGALGTDQAYGTAVSVTEPAGAADRPTDGVWSVAAEMIVVRPETQRALMAAAVPTYTQGDMMLSAENVTGEYWVRPKTQRTIGGVTYGVWNPVADVDNDVVGLKSPTLLSENHTIDATSIRLTHQET